MCGRRSKATLLMVVMFAATIGGCINPALDGFRSGITGGVDAGIQLLAEDIFNVISDAAFPEEE